MKRILFVAVVIISIFLAACSVNESTQEGLEGLEGLEELAEVIEKEAEHEPTEAHELKEETEPKEEIGKEEPEEETTKPNPEPAPQPTPQPRSEPQSKPEPQPQPQPKSEPQPAPQPKPDPTPEPKPLPEPTPEPLPEPKPEPESAPTQNVSRQQQMEEEMLRLVNEERRRHGLNPLIMEEQIVDVARLKSLDMIENNYFAHNSPVYGSPFDMMRRFGITYRTAGENLAGAGSVSSAHTNLMNSPGHRANILNPNFTHIGIGIVEGGPYRIMFTQMFVGRN